MENFDTSSASISMTVQIDDFAMIELNSQQLRNVTFEENQVSFSLTAGAALAGGKTLAFEPINNEITIKATNNCKRGHIRVSSLTISAR